MPIDWLVKYWNKAATAALPFLKDRKVAVQQVFGKQVIYRRHGDKGLPDKSGWIRISNVKEIKEWARLHTYSFHSHLLGEKDVWFVMDLDGRSDELWDLTKLAASELSKLLTRKHIKHLVKFSGRQGFHFMWSLGNIKPNWLSLRQQIRAFAQELEIILQSKYAKRFYMVIPKRNPIIVTSSTDRKFKRSILLDEQIVHKNGMIRSPYSVHPKTGLVSVPVKPSQLLKFNRQSARPEKVRPIKIFF
jgi:DNA primase